MQLNTKKQKNDRLFALTLGALGVVFGDIGTSPLYALRECFYGAHAVAVTPENILGILSIITWSLTLVISIKYVLFVMRADNHGEGGILALMTLAYPKPKPDGKDPKRILIYLGLFGAALLYGDGLITPSITVMGAVEGLQLAAPALADYVVPISIVILMLIFLPQKRGTGKIGAIFGPIILIWFAVLAILGAYGISLEPHVMRAFNPWYAYHFLLNNHWHGFVALGAVFLVVTGGEALYADMGHFGRQPIRAAWFWIVFPSLLLNYFGQGALLLVNPEARVNPFYKLAPEWMLYPLIGLATFAAVIASQALISGAFSLTRQAVQLGYLPRLEIQHTSSEEIGQIYVPQINWTLLLGTIFLVLEYRSSSNLAAAYGIAVSTTMVITTILTFFVARDHWKWGFFTTCFALVGFIGIDLAFFSANFIKLRQGGWLPLLVGICVLVMMTTWRKGRFILAKRLSNHSVPLTQFFKTVMQTTPAKVPGTAVFMSGASGGTPPALVHNFRHNKVLHEKVILLTVVTEAIPHVPKEERMVVEKLEDSFFKISIYYGFMDTPNIPAALMRCGDHGLDLVQAEMTYFVGRETLIATKKPGMAVWREHLFSFMSRNAQRAHTFFKLPANQVVELGMQVEL